MSLAHPIVNSFLSTDREIVLILKDAPKGDPAVEAMAGMSHAFFGKGSIEQAIRAADAVSFKGMDPDLAVLFLYLRARGARQMGRWAEVPAFLRRARALLTRKTPPELRAWIAYIEEVYSSANPARMEKIRREVLSILPADSPRRPAFLMVFANALAQQGRAAEMEAEIRISGKHRMHQEQYTRFIDCVETGRLQEADAHLKALRETPDWSAFNSIALKDYCLLLGLQRGSSRSATPSPEPDPADLPPWARILTALLGRDTNRALRQALSSRPAGADSLMPEPGFAALNDVRAELSAGHVQTARRMLDEKRGQGIRHYLDGLFYARMELASGRFDPAARHFASALAAARRYRAEGRLEFELRLSCELSPADVLRLSRAAPGRTSDRAPPAPASAPPLPPPRGIRRLVGESRALSDLRRAVRRYAPLSTAVLITGETGTGKELVAQALHEEGRRPEEPFLAVNCAAIAESLLESELFGHEKGAFTGAERSRRGLFEEAAEGTIFLDECGEITPRLQAALLRVLENEEIRPVGSSRSRAVSCRVIAATNSDLQGRVASGKFRKDLWYRLARLPLHIPPLRDRPADIGVLAEHFLNLDRAGGRRAVLTPALVAALSRNPWPGNVRELKHEMERMRLFNPEKASYGVEDLEADASVPAPQDPAGGKTAQDRPLPALDDERADRLLREGNSPLRRLERLRDFFRRHPALTREEIVRCLGTPPYTATRDLKRLYQEGFIEKITPTAAPRTHYFQLKQTDRS